MYKTTDNEQNLKEQIEKSVNQATVNPIIAVSLVNRENSGNKKINGKILYQIIGENLGECVNGKDKLGIPEAEKYFIDDSNDLCCARKYKNASSLTVYRELKDLSKTNRYEFLTSLNSKNYKDLHKELNKSTIPVGDRIINAIEKTVRAKQAEVEKEDIDKNKSKVVQEFPQSELKNPGRQLRHLVEYKGDNYLVDTVYHPGFCMETLITDVTKDKKVRDWGDATIISYSNWGEAVKSHDRIINNLGEYIPEPETFKDYKESVMDDIDDRDKINCLMFGFYYDIIKNPKNNFAELDILTKTDIRDKILDFGYFDDFNKKQFVSTTIGDAYKLLNKCEANPYKLIKSVTTTSLLDSKGRYRKLYEEAQTRKQNREKNKYNKEERD